jgi:hypothetical protein
MKMALVYDLRRDSGTRKKLLSRVRDQWDAYLRGEKLGESTKGHISDLFFAPYEGEHMFRLHGNGRTSSWTRLGDESWYVVGRRVKVEQVVFRVPEPIGDMPVVTRIWIESGAERE